MKDIGHENVEIIRPFNTAPIHRLLLAAISEAEAAGIDEETLDRMRLACETFTYQEFTVGSGDKAEGARP